MKKLAFLFIFVCLCKEICSNVIPPPADLVSNTEGQEGKDFEDLEDSLDIVADHYDDDDNEGSG